MGSLQRNRRGARLLRRHQPNRRPGVRSPDLVARLAAHAQHDDGVILAGRGSRCVLRPHRADEPTIVYRPSASSPRHDDGAPDHREDGRLRKYAQKYARDERTPAYSGVLQRSEAWSDVPDDQHRSVSTITYGHTSHLKPCRRFDSSLGRKSILILLRVHQTV